MRGRPLLGMLVVLAACAGPAEPSATTPAAPTTAVAPGTTQAVTTSPPGTAGAPLFGFSISPPDTSTEGFTAFLDRLGESSSLLEWVGDGFEWTEGGTPDVTVALAGQVGVEPITIGGWTRTEDGSLLRPLDDATVTGYVEAARAFAARHLPGYMGFGVEVDTHWREFPDDWEASTALFAAVAGAVHEASPTTQMVVVFQLERLRGLQGGLFGGENSEALAAWHLLDDFPDADVIGFTTYPGLVFESPAAMPDDYYAAIGERTSKPIAFTEMGWQAGGEFGAWSGSDAHQAEFITRFPSSIDGLDVEFVTWSYLFDQPIPGPFGTMALVTAGGVERPGWDAWLGLVAPR